MLAQIKAMTGLELLGLWGLNVFRFSRDRRVRRKAAVMAAVWGILLVVMTIYMGGLSYGLIVLGLAEVVPAYLLTIAGLMIFFFGIFKAGSVLFNPNGYDMFCALPLSQTAIVVSRFLRMYTENLVIALAVLLPGLAVYGWFIRPGVLVYLLGALGLLAIPLIPMAGAALIGALITGIAARMRRKSLVVSGLSILTVLALLFGFARLSAWEGEMSLERLGEAAASVSVPLERLFPIAAWLGRATVDGNVLLCLGCAALSIAVSVAVVCLISANFHAICQALYSTSARHAYQMERLRQEPALHALCRREFKRYFSSSVYVTNTIIGPVMGTILSAALLSAGGDYIAALLPASFNLRDLVPFGLSGIFCMMNATSTSISLEGKSWWLVKSLPLATKTILDAKILMNLLLLLPFYLVSEIMLILALRPTGLAAVWFVLIPVLIAVFSCVYGITMNLRFPVFDWASEVNVVKQSASATLGGMSGFLLAIVTLLAPAEYRDWVRLALCAVTAAVTWWLYRRNNRVDLREI